MRNLFGIKAGLVTLFTFLLALGAVPGGVPGGAHAQDSEPKVKFNFFEVTGASMVIGKSFKIDADYGAERDLPVNAPFSFIAPIEDDVLVKQQPTPGTDTLVKIVYGTKEQKFIENFQFSTLRVDMASDEERLKAIANVLANQGFGMVVQPYQNPSRDGVRKTKVGDYAAVEVFGRYNDPENGLMYTRLVGILNPKGEHSVYMVANIAAAQLPLENPDELATKTRSGAALTTFKFLD